MSSIDEFGPETLERLKIKAIDMARDMGIPIEYAKATIWADERNRRRAQWVAQEWERMHGKVSEIDRKMTLVESVTHALASMFKVGAEFVDKSYPGKKK